MTGYMFRNVQYRLELRDALGSMGPAAATTAAAQNNQLDLYNSTAARQAYSTMERSQSAPVPSSVLDTEQYAPGVQKSRVQVRAEARHVLTGLSHLLKRKLLIACCWVAPPGGQQPTTGSLILLKAVPWCSGSCMVCCCLALGGSSGHIQVGCGGFFSGLCKVRGRRRI